MEDPLKVELLCQGGYIAWNLRLGLGARLPNIYKKLQEITSKGGFFNHLFKQKKKLSKLEGLAWSHWIRSYFYKFFFNNVNISPIRSLS